MQKMIEERMKDRFSGFNFGTQKREESKEEKKEEKMVKKEEEEKKESLQK